MAASCRFAFAIHVLAVLAFKSGRGVTSDVLAASVNTNPVVIRRLLSTLREAGLVATRRGAGAGSMLSRPPAEISLEEIYRATEPAASFASHPHRPNARCLVGRNISAVLTSIFGSARTALEEALSHHTLAEVLVTISNDAPSAPAKTSGRQRKTT